MLLNILYHITIIINLKPTLPPAIYTSKKDASINDEIDRMFKRYIQFNGAQRRDCSFDRFVYLWFRFARIVAGYAYSFGMRKEYSTDKLKRELTTLQYERNDDVLERARFRNRGDVFTARVS